MDEQPPGTDSEGTESQLVESPVVESPVAEPKAPTGPMGVRR